MRYPDTEQLSEITIILKVQLWSVGYANCCQPWLEADDTRSKF
jgi:hypothetical protein